MRKRSIQTILAVALILSSFAAYGCGDEEVVSQTKLTEFTVSERIDANYASVFQIPEAFAKDSDGKLVPATVTVTKRSDGQEVKVSDNELLISDVGGYILTYRVEKDGNVQTETTAVNVVDTQAPVITFEGISDQKVYTSKTASFAIPLDKVKASDNLSTPRISYKTFKDGQEIAVFNDTLNVSEAGQYDVVFSATDANGNVGEKTLTVYAVDCDESVYLDFETEWDTDKIYGNNMTANYLRTTRVAYDDLDIAKPENGGDYAVLMTPILSATYPRYHFDFGKTLPAGTEISYQMYFEAHEIPDKLFTIEGSENCTILSTDYKHNEWIEVKAILTNETRYMSSFLHLALLDGFDTPAYNYSAGIQVFIDNVTVKASETDYTSFNMVKDHIYNTSTSSYLDVSYENCEIGGYSGMAFKMTAPANNKIIFDAEAMAFLKVYATLNNYTTITAHVYTTAGNMALNTWSTESLPASGAWFEETKTIATLPEYFYVMRNAGATVYMYFEFA